MSAYYTCDCLSEQFLVGGLDLAGICTYRADLTYLRRAADFLNLYLFMSKFQVITK